MTQSPLAGELRKFALDMPDQAAELRAAADELDAASEEMKTAEDESWSPERLVRAHSAARVLKAACLERTS